MHDRVEADDTQHESYDKDFIVVDDDDVPTRGGVYAA